MCLLQDGLIQRVSSYYYYYDDDDDDDYCYYYYYYKWRGGGNEKKKKTFFALPNQHLCNNKLFDQRLSRFCVHSKQALGS